MNARAFVFTGVQQPFEAREFPNFAGCGFSANPSRHLWQSRGNKIANPGAYM